LHDNLEGLSLKISAAQAALEEAETALASARVPRDHIAARLEHMAQERAAIVARRAGGEHQTDDGARLELLAVDSQGLQTLLRNSETVLAEANATCTAARTDLADAQSAYAAEEKRSAVAAYDAHADRLLELLAQTLAHRNAAAAGLGLEDRALGRMTARLVTFDRLVAGECQAVRAALRPNIPYGARPVWMPSQALYDNTFRLRNSDGKFW
jgi:chromosome segregation ATPase